MFLRAYNHPAVNHQSSYQVTSSTKTDQKNLNFDTTLWCDMADFFCNFGRFAEF